MNIYTSMILYHCPATFSTITKILHVCSRNNYFPHKAARGCQLKLGSLSSTNARKYFVSTGSEQDLTVRNLQDSQKTGDFKLN